MMRYLFCLIFVCLSGLLPAQTPRLHLLAKAKNNRVMLRWGASEAALWWQANRVGYKLERRTLRNGQLVDEGFTPRFFKPYSKEALASLAKQDDRVEAIEELLYRKPFQPLQAEESPAALLKKRQELSMYFSSFLLVCDFCPLCAQGAGLAWTDSTARAGEEYAYQISLAEQASTCAPAAFVVKVEADKPLLAPQELRADFRDKQAMLAWSLRMDRGVYSGYWVERSEDGRNFQALDTAPFVFASEAAEPQEAFYLDSLPQNSKTYYYRLKGVTPFGEASPPSAIVSGAGKENLNGLLLIDSARVQQNKQVTLYWHMNADARRRLKGFHIRRSAGGGAPFLPLTTRLLSPQTESYTDAPPQSSNYYEVVAIGKDGAEVARSFPYFALLEDNTPPAPPQGLAGKIDAKGVVTLRWRSNTEQDLRGYRVFRANNPTEEYVEVTRYLLQEPTFTDSVYIETLTRHVYYKVVATDISFNPSDYSQALVLNRPDHIAPSAPLFTQMRVHGDTLTLGWVASSSEDVAHYHLSRQQKGDTAWHEVGRWQAKRLPLLWEETSRSLEMGAAYRYRLSVLDSAQNRTDAFSPLQYFETGYRPAVALLPAVVDKEKRVIQLSWTYADAPISRCLIYKANNENAMTLYQTLTGNPKLFEDKQVQINNRYRYQIQLVYKNGVRTSLSREVEITY